MGPVWEANHVWLILVLTVCWTAYPVAFASITSTLTLPLFIAALGIILRGSAYALRGQAEGAREQRVIERVFALSSILTPFALGSVIGGIASGRVPVGNARGSEITSWLNPTSVVIGVLTVATSSYLAAVYLAADARRLGERELERDFRDRALAAGAVAGALALAGLLVVRSDARPIWNGLTHGAGLAMVGLSGLAGLATLALVWRCRFGPARASAALAVASIVAGWALAQQPRFLPGLTIRQAAAGHSTLVAVIIGVAIGAVVLAPSLVLLFGLFLRGHLDAGGGLVASALVLPRALAGDRRRLLGATAIVTFVLGAALMLILDAGSAHAAGVACLIAAAVSAFALAATVPNEEG
jgi:cytochrome d ubiquinol oxidase subunit II